MAHVDYFLKIDGIDGESSDHKHKSEIEVLSWSWGETQTGTHVSGGGGGAGKVAMQDFHFVMLMNKASAKLAKACATGVISVTDPIELTRATSRARSRCRVT